MVVASQSMAKTPPEAMLKRVPALPSASVKAQPALLLEELWHSVVIAVPRKLLFVVPFVLLYLGWTLGFDLQTPLVPVWRVYWLTWSLFTCSTISIYKKNWNKNAGLEAMKRKD